MRKEAEALEVLLAAPPPASLPLPRNLSPFPQGLHSSQQEVAKNMEAAGVEAIVPKPNKVFLSPRVLVMDFCHGFSVRDTASMDKHGVDRGALMHRICRAFAVQMHVNGFFNAGEPLPSHGLEPRGRRHPPLPPLSFPRFPCCRPDRVCQQDGRRIGRNPAYSLTASSSADPHPGNILVSTSESQNGGDPSVPVLLDFGLTKRFTPHMLVAFARMMHATYSMDVDELVAAFKVPAECKQGNGLSRQGNGDARGRGKCGGGGLHGADVC